MTSQSSTWFEVRQRLRRDHERLRGLRGPNGLPLGILALNPSYQCIWLHRVSNYFFRRNHRLLARFLLASDLLLTGADITNQRNRTRLAAGSSDLHAIFGRLGADCTIWGHCGVGGGREQGHRRWSRPSDHRRQRHSMAQLHGAGSGTPRPRRRGGAGMHHYARSAPRNQGGTRGKPPTVDREFGMMSGIPRSRSSTAKLSFVGFVRRLRKPT